MGCSVFFSAVYSLVYVKFKWQMQFGCLTSTSNAVPLHQKKKKNSQKTAENLEQRRKSQNRRWFSKFLTKIASKIQPKVDWRQIFFVIECLLGSLRAKNFFISTTKDRQFIPSNNPRAVRTWGA